MISRIYGLVQILSIQVVGGAVVSALVISRTVGNVTDASTYILLGLTVWIVYTFDHLLDAFRLHGVTGTKRHTFHKRHFDSIAIVMGLGILIAFGLLINQPRYVIINGAILILFVILYFAMINLMPTLSGLAREITAALLYCMGVMIPSVDLTSLSPDIYFMFSIYLIFAWLNLLIISVFERKTDTICNFPSMIRMLGKRKTGLLIHLLFVIGLVAILGAGTVIHRVNGISVLFGIMLVTLFVIFKFQVYFKKNERYRIWSDLIFLFPVIFI